MKRMMFKKIFKYMFWCLFTIVAFFVSSVIGCVLRMFMPLWLLTLICVLLIAMCFMKLAENANDSENGDE